jgi:hypothetical protein
MRIALPQDVVSTTDAIAIEGMGFGERGSFRLGSSSGRFTRHALSERDMAPFAATDLKHFYGGGSLSVEGPDFQGVVEAECRYREIQERDGPTTTTVVLFVYRCTFMRDGRPLEAELILRAAPRRVWGLTAETRTGEISLNGRTIMLQPIHDSPDTRLPAVDPLGYRFVSDGRDIGAINLNGERKMLYAPRTPEDREAVLVTGLALSILWYG